jgi:phenylacetic acid degradation protein paaN
LNFLTTFALQIIMNMHTASSQNIKLVQDAIEANKKRTYYTPYPEHPKAYGEGKMEEGLAAFQASMNHNFTGIKHGENTKWVGEEISPFMQVGLGIHYPQLSVEETINNSKNAAEAWQKMDVNSRASVLVDTLEAVKERFFELAFATMHTTGQSFLMSFQASGPHSNDRALETIAQGVEEMSKYPNEVEFVKPMGKFDLTIKKNYKAIPKGIGLVVGCSTFPTWNTVPGVYANLISGNSVIIKPHPKAILPIAIVVSCMQEVFEKNGLDANLVQLASDTINDPVTKHYAEHKEVNLIDYTGGSAFGDYLETLDKTVFTEKAGVNSVILDSAQDLNKVAQNIAFSASLYSGQMCTAPQNVYVSESGISTPEGNVSYDDFVTLLANSVKGLVEHPKMGAGTLGAIQNDATAKRVDDLKSGNGELKLDNIEVVNPEFADARVKSPIVLSVNSSERDKFLKECFGPVIMVIKTKSFDESLELSAESAVEHGAITCLAFSTDEEKINLIEDTMNKAFTPVSFNFTGAAFVNQHAAFSDFHVTGGNPAGNATFTNSEYINRRFVWVGNRFA